MRLGVARRGEEGKMGVGATALSGMQVATARLARSAYKVANVSAGFTSALDASSQERPSAPGARAGV